MQWLAKRRNVQVVKIDLPEPDLWWFPVGRADLRQQDVETVYLEITSGKAAGAAPHEWK